MAQAEPDASDTEQRCRAAVDGLRARYDWQVLTRSEFVARTLETLQAGLATDPVRAAIGAYSAALYAACAQSADAARQQRAYTELGRYLYDQARVRYPDICDDITQSALLRVFAALDRCRSPIAFLAFAHQHLLDAARALRRETRTPARSLDAPANEHLAHQPPAALADNGQSLVNHALANERRELLMRYRAEFLQAHPRAAQQFDALWMKYVDGMDDATISKKLGVSVIHVHALRTRAKKRLQANPDWRRLAAELGILPEET